MQEIGKIKQWYWPIAELNTLYNQNIINIDQTQRKTIDKNIDGKTVAETLAKLNEEINCTFTNDYDCDGKDNAYDNCPNHYNPSQKDTDTDKIGDVCDDDIDNDTIKNPIGIVDEEGKIDIAKRNQNSDNCIFTINTWQEDENWNRIGDACENKNYEIGLYINIDKLEGTAPVTTTFTAIHEGNIYEILRDFGDNTQGTWSSITHTFTTPGMYNVQATTKENDKLTAEVIVIVWGQKEPTTSLQARANSIGWINNMESTLSAINMGEFDEIERIFPRETIHLKKTPNQNVKKIFKESWENPVLVKWYSNGKLIGISYFTIGIDTGKWAILRSSSTNPEINQSVLFDTKTYNLRQEDIIKVTWDFGDGNTISNTTLTLEHTYIQPWKKVITQTITCSDGTKLTNSITLYITDKTLATSYALLMIPSTLTANIGQKIQFSTFIIGTLFTAPRIQIAKFWDNITQKTIWTAKMQNILTHTYQKNWILTPENSIYINQCTYLNNKATITIKDTDSCLVAKIQGTLKKYRCDWDKDGIPDLCDTDIDGDGIQNLLWLINFENKDCSYTSGNLNQDILTKHFQSICSLDNAPFDTNIDQLDLNQDGIGDKDTTVNIWNNEIIDSDGDGIPDNQDLCPTIQETWNGITDEDGCPEIGQELWCIQQWWPLLWTTNYNLIVKPTECNQCPCQFSDFSSDITNDDQIRAILQDKKKTTQYKFSLPWIVDMQ